LYECRNQSSSYHSFDGNNKHPTLADAPMEMAGTMVVNDEQPNSTMVFNDASAHDKTGPQGTMMTVTSSSSLQETGLCVRVSVCVCVFVRYSLFGHVATSKKCVCVRVCDLM
jgi:hypothetical protein